MKFRFSVPFHIWSGVLLLTIFSFLDSVTLAAADSELHRLRAARRQQHQTLQLSTDKDGSPALFGLLVIPVDFSDARLSADWNSSEELSPRLNPSQGETLHNYFSVASGQKLDLRITTAPLVHLSGTRRDYSDIGYNGFSRTRALATQALEAVRDLGLEFRGLDMEGPDRQPGSADDDGQLDGVLILHSGIGQENDPVNGQVQALQFYLDQPVESGGIQASFYAVASLQSGPGIWAHETGHLLGMEDRYDYLLHPASGGGDVRSLGGLGRFSLMASGAWGTGYGWGAALPDAYTSLQLGWYTPEFLPRTWAPVDTIFPSLISGTASRIWTQGETGSEFFLLETRNPDQTAPFDAGIPSGQMLVYHVDESIPEGSWVVDEPGQWHLRVNLVEADNDRGLASGEDDGRPEDLFPGPLGVQDFTPYTQPSSWGYQGNSLVSLTGIASGDSLVTFHSSASEGPALNFVFSFGSELSSELDLTVQSVGTPVQQLACSLSTSGMPTWGNFQGGTDLVEFDLEEVSPGVWSPVGAVIFERDTDVPAGQSTDFTFLFSSTTWMDEPEDRNWIWLDPDNPLDFQSSWPGEWTISFGGTTETTTWYRWVGPPYLSLQQTPVLAATGQSFSTPAAWPLVHYNNNAWVSLQSGELGPGTRAVRILHAVETEVLTPGQAMDGGRLAWAGPGSSMQPAIPVDGYPARILAQSYNPLGGAEVFSDSLLTLADQTPYWRVDVVPVPDEPGPWQLKLEFASNSLWRYKGWFVAELAVLSEPFVGSAFPVSWSSAEGLTWQWPFADLTVDGFTVQTLTADGTTWETIVPMTSATAFPPDDLLSLLDRGAQTRQLVRVAAHTEYGPVASLPIVVYPDGGFQTGVSLGLPRPNPTHGQVSVTVEIPEGTSGTLKIYDLHGRLLQDLSYPAGRHLVAWDGRDSRGAGCAAGTYIIRLEGSGQTQMRKVVLLH